MECTPAWMAPSHCATGRSGTIAAGLGPAKTPIISREASSAGSSSAPTQRRTRSVPTSFGARSSTWSPPGAKASADLAGPPRYEVHEHVLAKVFRSGVEGAATIDPRDEGDEFR